MRPMLALAVATLAATAAHAQPAAPSRPVVVELFTSEGCSSCPPADAVLRELARERPDVLALGFHVTYWDNLGWRDPFALPLATQRQRDYAALKVGFTYTPQMVVDGAHDVIGSERDHVLRTIREAAPAAGVTVRLHREPDELVAEIGAGAGRGAVLLVGYDPEHRTPVARGENAGRSLVEANIVRALVPIGDWSGRAVSLRHAVPAGERMAVIVQAADGRILGAAREDGHAS